MEILECLIHFMHQWIYGGDDMSNSKLRIVKVMPNKNPEVCEIERGLKDLQEIVDGTIQCIYPFDDDVGLVCNDDGKLLGLPYNRALFYDWDKTEMYQEIDGKQYVPIDDIYDVIVGTFFICRTPADSDKFESLTDEQVNKYLTLFARKETLAKDMFTNQLFIVRERGD